MRGGHITCHSERHKGTVIQIYLPTIEATLLPDMYSTGEMPGFGTETVLLVDDEELVLSWGVEILTQAGYTVLTAGTGREALKQYRKSQSEISLVILDLIMPDMGGRQCLQELHAMDSSVKAIITSGFPVDKETRKYLESHSKEFIAKPFNAKELLRQVRKVLDSE